MAEASTQVETEHGWYACRTRSRAEKKAHALLLERGVESYLPIIPERHRWCDRHHTVLVPLFAGYVFARARDLLPVFETPCVCDVVRFAGRPALIPDPEIRNIERFVQALGARRPAARPVAFREGERVRINGGQFAGVEAVVMRGKDRRRVVVGLAAINTGYEIDVPATLLEPVATGVPATAAPRDA